MVIVIIIITLHHILANNCFWLLVDHLSLAILETILEHYFLKFILHLSNGTTVCNKSSFTDLFII